MKQGDRRINTGNLAFVFNNKEMLLKSTSPGWGVLPLNFHFLTCQNEALIIVCKLLEARASKLRVFKYKLDVVQVTNC